jgi:hypothetical protein
MHVHGCEYAGVFAIRSRWHLCTRIYAWFCIHNAHIHTYTRMWTRRCIRTLLKLTFTDMYTSWFCIHETHVHRQTDRQTDKRVSCESYSQVERIYAPQQSSTHRSELQTYSFIDTHPIKRWRCLVCGSFVVSYLLAYKILRIFVAGCR